MTKKKTPQTIEECDAELELTQKKIRQYENRAYVAHVLKPPEGLQGRCRLHKIPPSELGGFLKRLANRRWNSSAFHAILCAFAPIYARTTVFAA